MKYFYLICLLFIHLFGTEIQSLSILSKKPKPPPLSLLGSSSSKKPSSTATGGLLSSLSKSLTKTPKPDIDDALLATTEKESIRPTVPNAVRPSATKTGGLLSSLAKSTAPKLDIDDGLPATTKKESIRPTAPNAVRPSATAKSGLLSSISKMTTTPPKPEVDDGSLATTVKDTITPGVPVTLIDKPIIPPAPDVAYGSSAKTVKNSITPVVSAAVQPSATATGGLLSSLSKLLTTTAAKPDIDDNFPATTEKESISQTVPSAVRPSATETGGLLSSLSKSTAPKLDIDDGLPATTKKESIRPTAPNAVRPSATATGGLLSSISKILTTTPPKADVDDGSLATTVKDTITPRVPVTLIDKPIISPVPDVDYSLSAKTVKSSITPVVPAAVQPSATATGGLLSSLSKLLTTTAAKPDIDDDFPATTEKESIRPTVPNAVQPSATEPGGLLSSISKVLTTTPPKPDVDVGLSETTLRKSITPIVPVEAQPSATGGLLSSKPNVDDGLSAAVKDSITPPVPVALIDKPIISPVQRTVVKSEPNTEHVVSSTPDVVAGSLANDPAIKSPPDVRPILFAVEKSDGPVFKPSLTTIVPSVPDVNIEMKSTSVSKDEELPEYHLKDDAVSPKVYKETIVVEVPLASVVQPTILEDVGQQNIELQEKGEKEDMKNLNLQDKQLQSVGKVIANSGLLSSVSKLLTTPPKRDVDDGSSATTVKDTITPAVPVVLIDKPILPSVSRTIVNLEPNIQLAVSSTPDLESAGSLTKDPETNSPNKPSAVEKRDDRVFLQVTSIVPSLAEVNIETKSPSVGEELPEYNVKDVEHHDSVSLKPEKESLINNIVPLASVVKLAVLEDEGQENVGLQEKAENVDNVTVENVDMKEVPVASNMQPASSLESDLGSSAPYVTNPEGIIPELQNVDILPSSEKALTDASPRNDGTASSNVGVESPTEQDIDLSTPYTEPSSETPAIFPDSRNFSSTVDLSELPGITNLMSTLSSGLMDVLSTLMSALTSTPGLKDLVIYILSILHVILSSISKMNGVPQAEKIISSIPVLNPLLDGLLYLPGIFSGVLWNSVSTSRESLFRLSTLQLNVLIGLLNLALYFLNYILSAIPHLLRGIPLGIILSGLQEYIGALQRILPNVRIERSVGGPVDISHKEINLMTIYI